MIYLIVAKDYAGRVVTDAGKKIISATQYYQWTMGMKLMLVLKSLKSRNLYVSHEKLKLPNNSGK
jgi:hypothetical protein